MLALSASLLWGCPPGSISWPDAGCPGCDAADPCDGPGCGDEPGDPCASVECPTGQYCFEGRCRTVDRCEGVTCSGEGEVCDPRDGACHPGHVDADGDGYTLADGDCDDGDPTVHPGAVEVCNGVDDDCDGDVDEDLGARPCSTACGSGEERCLGGRWVCSAPVECECTSAGTRQEEGCGRCGSRSRTCMSDLSWSDWSACTGEGPCASGEVDTEPCGLCGTRSRTCSADCRWGAFGDCGGEGECAPLSTSPCTTSCGSTGSRSCDASCRFGACSPPGEVCNGVDDDCDGVCDEGCRHGIHRSASPGDHSYSEDAVEAACCGYTVEFWNFFYLSTTEVAGTVPFYRCYFPGPHDHMLTTSATCEGAGASYLERSIGHVATAATCGAVALYRLYGATQQNHFFTTSAAERDNAIAVYGYVSEGIAGYVWTTP